MFQFSRTGLCSPNQLKRNRRVGDASIPDTGLEVGRAACVMCSGCRTEQTPILVHTSWETPRGAIYFIYRQTRARIPGKQSVPSLSSCHHPFTDPSIHPVRSSLSPSPWGLPDEQRREEALRNGLLQWERERERARGTKDALPGHLSSSVRTKVDFFL